MQSPEPLFRVRRAQVADIPALRSVRLEALSDTPDAFGSTYEREIARTQEDWLRWLSPGAAFLLDTDTGAAGMVACAHDRNNVSDDASIVWLMAMWVRGSWRATGAAAALVDAVKVWAGEECASEVRLKVIDTNLRACQFYERVGFQLTGRQNPRERDGMTELEMAFRVK